MTSKTQKYLEKFIKENVTDEDTLMKFCEGCARNKNCEWGDNIPYCFYPKREKKEATA